MACSELNWRLNVCLQLASILYKMAASGAGAAREPVRCQRAAESAGRERERTSVAVYLSRYFYVSASCFSVVRAMLRQRERERYSYHYTAVRVLRSLSLSLSLSLYLIDRRVCIFIYKYFSAILLLSVCFDGIRRRIVLIIYTLFLFIYYAKTAPQKIKG